MEYRRLGLSGLFVSEIGLGGNTFGRFCDADETARVIHQALDSGVTFIDTADSYNGGLSEEFVGRALAGRREQAIVATKTGWPVGPSHDEQGLSRHRIMARVEGSLKRLGTDYIDVYYMHRPDPNTPLEESLRAFDDLIRAGKVRYSACSNYPGWQIAEMVKICEQRGYSPPVVCQSNYNVLERDIEREVIPACDHFGLSIVPHSPLAGGFLTGKYLPGQPPPPDARGHGNPTWQERRLTETNFRAQEVLAEFAVERSHTILELALAWLLANDSVCSVIAGVTRPEQVEANVRAAEWRLTASDLEEIDRRLDDAELDVAIG
jgi:aryl-alcohol dehydrogenase-like predicted oxidoreductase